jgi:transposase
MAYFKTKRISGQDYLYIYETRLVDGRPVPKMLEYLGKADGALARLRGVMPQEEIKSFSHGAVAVALSLADQLGVADIIDRAAAEPRKGAPRHDDPSVGWTLVLGAIGLTVRPTSKRAFSSWVSQTTLPVLGKFDPEALTSQYFWDQMDRIPLEALERIGDELTPRVLELVGARLDTLFYDNTNFYTFIDSGNDRCTIARRGDSKQKRRDLRQVNVGLLVARDGWLPLRHDIFRGNQNDVSRFPEAIAAAGRRLEALGVSPGEVTLVCDQGNISKATLAELDASGLHHVTSLPPGRMKDLSERPLEEFIEIDVREVGRRHALRAERELAGRTRTVVVLDSPTLREGQLRGLGQTLMRPVGALMKLAHHLVDGRRRKRERLEAQVRRIIKTARAAGSLLRWEITDADDGRYRLEWWIDQDAYCHLRERVYGRRVLVTDRAEWSTEEILLAYWGASEAEHAFAALKDPRHCAIHTPHHWTDQKLAVHTFMAVLAYTFMAVIRRRARTLGMTEGARALVQLLDDVRVARCKEVRTGRGRPRVRWQAEEIDPSAQVLYRELVSPRYDLGSISREAPTRTARTG